MLKIKFRRVLSLFLCFTILLTNLTVFAETPTITPEDGTEIEWRTVDGSLLGEENGRDYRVQFTKAPDYSYVTQSKPTSGNYDVIPEVYHYKDGIKPVNRYRTDSEPYEVRAGYYSTRTTYIYREERYVSGTKTVTDKARWTEYIYENRAKQVLERASYRKKEWYKAVAGYNTYKYVMNEDGGVDKIRVWVNAVWKSRYVTVPAVYNTEMERVLVRTITHAAVTHKEDVYSNRTVKVPQTKRVWNKPVTDYRDIQVFDHIDYIPDPDNPVKVVDASEKYRVYVKSEWEMLASTAIAMKTAQQILDEDILYDLSVTNSVEALGALLSNATSKGASSSVIQQIKDARDAAAVILQANTDALIQSRYNDSLDEAALQLLYDDAIRNGVSQSILDMISNRMNELSIEKKLKDLTDRMNANNNDLIELRQIKTDAEAEGFSDLVYTIDNYILSIEQRDIAIVDCKLMINLKTRSSELIDLRDAAAAIDISLVAYLEARLAILLEHESVMASIDSHTLSALELEILYNQYNSDESIKDAIINAGPFYFKFSDGLVVIKDLPFALGGAIEVTEADFIAYINAQSFKHNVESDKIISSPSDAFTFGEGDINNARYHEFIYVVNDGEIAKYDLNTLKYKTVYGSLVTDFDYNEYGPGDFSIFDFTMGVISGAVKGVWDEATELIQVVSKVVTNIGSAVSKVVKGVAGAISFVVKLPAAIGNIDLSKETLSALVNSIKTFLNFAGDAFSQLEDNEFGKGLGYLLGTIMADKITGPIGGVLDMVDKATGGSTITRVMKNLFSLITSSSVGPIRDALGDIITQISKIFRRAPGNTDDVLLKVISKTGCFVAGTKILTETGYKDIEDIVVGDVVYSMNMKDNIIEKKLVYATFIGIKEDIYEITIDGTLIEATEEHPFWVVGKGWIEAKNLSTDDVLLDKNNEKQNINQITKRTTSGTTIYNLSVEDNHNYFVSKENILTHNIDCKKFKIKFDIDSKLLESSKESLLAQVKSGEMSQIEFDEIADILKKNGNASFADELRDAIKGTSNLGKFGDLYTQAYKSVSIEDANGVVRRAITEAGEEVRFIIPKGYDDMADFAKALDDGIIDVTEYGCKNSDELVELLENQNKYLNTRNTSGNFNGQSHLKDAGKTVNGVEYDNLGFPIFEGSNLKYNAELPDNLLIATDTSQFKECTRQLNDAINNGTVDGSIFTPKQLQQIEAGEARIDGLIWHHHQVKGKIQLVPKTIHQPGHLGGNALWGEGVRK